jgi:hypothetical protein
VPKSAFSPPPERDGIYEFMTMRADGQFNTTIFTEDDRFGGVQGSRYVVLMNPADMDAEGLKQGDTVTLSTEANDGVERTLSDLQVVAYDIPAREHCGLHPGVEWAYSALALCRGQQGSGSKIHSGAHLQGCRAGAEGGEMPIAAT